QDPLVAEVARDAWSLANVRGWPLEVVVCDPAHQSQGFLTYRQQALSLGGHRGTETAVRVDHPVQVGRGHVNGAVDHEPGGVRRIVRFAQEIAVLVQLDEGRRSDLVEEHPEWVEKKMLGAGNTRREMGVVQVGPAVDGSQSVRRGKVHARLPFLRPHVRWWTRGSLGYNGLLLP